MLSGTFGNCAGKCAKSKMKCMPAGCDTFNGERDCVIRFNGKDACNGCTDHCISMCSAFGLHCCKQNGNSCQCNHGTTCCAT